MARKRAETREDSTIREKRQTSLLSFLKVQSASLTSVPKESNTSDKKKRRKTTSATLRDDDDKSAENDETLTTHSLARKSVNTGNVHDKIATTCSPTLPTTTRRAANAPRVTPDSASDLNVKDKSMNLEQSKNKRNDSAEEGETSEPASILQNWQESSASSPDRKKPRPLNSEDDGLSEYELLRLRNIQRNNARLEALGLLNKTNATDLSSSLSTTRTKKKKKRNSPSTTQAPSIPTRRSTRRQRQVLQQQQEETSSSVNAASSNPSSSRSTPELEEPVEESYTISPLLQYSMDTAQTAKSTVSASTCVWSDTVTTNSPSSSSSSSSSSLSLLNTRLVPPKGLTALYSLQFSPQHPRWMVGAGKAGIVALWDTSDKPSFEDDLSYQTIDPRLSWKAHGGRWIADARFVQDWNTTSITDHNKSIPSRLLTAANDGCVCLWDLTSVSASTGAPKLLDRTGKERHASGIFAMDLYSEQPHIQHVATGSKDKTIAISTMTGGGGIGPCWWTSDHHSAKVGDVRFRGKGTSLIGSVSDDGLVAIHDYRQQRIVAESTYAHGRPHSILWHPHEDYTFMTAGHDKTVHLWDLRRFGDSPDSACPIATLEGHVPSQLSKCKRIHRPIFLSCPNANTSWVLTSGEASQSLSLFSVRSSPSNPASKQVVLESRGRLPDECGDGGCLAMHGNNQIAVSTNQGDVVLVRPNLRNDP